MTIKKKLVSIVAVLALMLAMVPAVAFMQQNQTAVAAPTLPANDIDINVHWNYVSGDPEDPDSYNYHATVWLFDVSTGQFNSAVVTQGTTLGNQFYSAGASPTGYYAAKIISYASISPFLTNATDAKYGGSAYSYWQTTKSAVNFIATDGYYAKYSPAFNDVFAPAVFYGDTSQTGIGSIPEPEYTADEALFALESGNLYIPSGDTALDIFSSISTDYDTAPRFFMGLGDGGADYGGNRFPSEVTDVLLP